jgi:hypothetical protein
VGRVFVRRAGAVLPLVLSGGGGGSRAALSRGLALAFISGCACEATEAATAAPAAA